MGARARSRPSSRSATPRRRRRSHRCARPVEPAMTAAGKHIGAPILRADRISLAFGGIKALSDISLEIREHEILAIIGPNGAGKTSMLNVINGFYHPQQGTITYKGETR